MRRVFGPRTAIEAAFLVAVPVVSFVVVGLGTVGIIAASAVGYLLVVLLEALLWREKPAFAMPRLRRARPPRPVPAPVVEPVTQRTVVAEPVPVEQPVPEPELTPVVPELEPVPTPEPEPVRALQPVPDLEPEPEPEPEPARELEPDADVIPIGVSGGPRNWNLWDLERLTRDVAGLDLARDEERTFLLMYLREFAGPDGSLPLDFDGLVRDSFGDLVGVR